MDVSVHSWPPTGTSPKVFTLQRRFLTSHCTGTGLCGADDATVQQGRHSLDLMLADGCFTCKVTAFDGQFYLVRFTSSRSQAGGKNPPTLPPVIINDQAMEGMGTWTDNKLSLETYSSNELLSVCSCRVVQLIVKHLAKPNESV